MEHALRGLSWSQWERYDECSADDPRGKIGPGSVDDLGAERLGIPQTTYRGFVSQLQADLRMFGFNPGAIDGVYGPGTDRALRLFQEAALTCPHRGQGITFTGTISGAVDNATRAELTLWRVYRQRRHMEPLKADRANNILLEVAIRRHGRKALSRYSHHPDKGLIFGLLDFDQRSGALGDLLWRLWSASPRSFRFVFKLGGEEAVITRVASRDPDTRMSVDLSAGEWSPRFARAGDVGFWAHEQLRLAREQRLRPVLVIAARFGLRHESAIAALLLIAEHGSVHMAAAAAAQLGRRQPGEPVIRHILKLPKVLETMGSTGRNIISPLRELLGTVELDDCPLLVF